MSDPAGRLLLVTQYFPPERGAAQVRLAAVVRELGRQGVEVEVITALPSYPEGRTHAEYRGRPYCIEHRDGVRVHRVWAHPAMGGGARRILNYLTFAVGALVALARVPRPAWVLIETPPPFAALPALAMARRWGSRTVVNVADLWGDSVRELGLVRSRILLRALDRLEAWVLARADAVTVVTEGVRGAVLAKGVDPERIAWLPNGVDIDLFRPGPPDVGPLHRLALEDRAVFVYAGTHGYVHGLDVVLDAADHLRDRPITFLLVGDGSEKARLVEEARRRRLDAVRFLHPVSPEEVAALLRIATAGLATVRGGDLYATVRSAKSFPTMASGRPVIYSGADEGADLVRAIGAGITTPPGDGRALADAVVAIVDDPAGAAEMGRTGRAWVSEHVQWSRLVACWMAEVGLVGAADGVRRPA